MSELIDLKADFNKFVECFDIFEKHNADLLQSVSTRMKRLEEKDPSLASKGSPSESDSKVTDPNAVKPILKRLNSVPASPVVDPETSGQADGGTESWREDFESIKDYQDPNCPIICV